MSEFENKTMSDAETLTDIASSDETVQNQEEKTDCNEIKEVEIETEAQETEENSEGSTDSEEIQASNVTAEAMEQAETEDEQEDIVPEKNLSVAAVTVEPVSEEAMTEDAVSEETSEEPSSEGKLKEQQADSDRAEQTVLPLDTGRGEAILEGLLFIVGDDGLTAEQAAAVLDIEPSRVEDLFEALQKKYTDDQYGIEIANYGGTYRFLSKAFVHDYAKKLFQISKEATLSQAALETLAIIAYKQPITRVEIEEIRGVGADMMLRKLLARDLIRESGRSDAPGRPILYEVTPEFMDSFKLLSLDELPDLPKFGDEESEESDDLFK